MSNPINKQLWQLILVISGSFIIACAVAFFLLPGKIVTGGTPGMALLIHFISGLPTGAGILIVNIPLLALGFRFIDRKFAIKSVLSIVTTAASVELLHRFVNFPMIESNLLNVLYGGVLVGIGVALVLKGQASAGGTTIIARIVSHYWNFKPAQIILLVDMSIISASGFIFADMERILWSALSIYITIQVLDRILSGVVQERIVHIVSTKPRHIGEAIQQKLGRDGTILAGNNLNGSVDKNILFVVVGSRRIPALKQVVTDIDPNALMIVMEASEITGSSRLNLT